MASHRPILFRFGWLHNTIAATLASCLACMILLVAPVYALDPNKRLTQYIHTSWRTQDGSAPSGIQNITQTSDGFLWLLSLTFDVYRFDGFQFRPWSLPTRLSTRTAAKVFGDHSGGFWVLGPRDIVHLKDGVVISHFDVEGGAVQSISEDPDGSLWVVRGNPSSPEPICHLSDGAGKCFGKADGIPISTIDSLLADGSGGLWLGGQTALAHWHSGVSETYRIAALKPIGIGISSLARTSDGSLWVGILGKGPGQGLEQFRDGTVRPFATPTFDGSNFMVAAMMVDHDGDLWVGTVGAGLFRIHGNVVDHYDHTEGLSGDSVYALFEDREGIVWAGTTSGIDSFRDPRVATFSLFEGLGQDLAAGVLASGDGTIWVANAGELDHIVNGSVSSIRMGKGLPGEQVTAMLEDHSGNLWVGVDDELYLLKNGHFRRIPTPNHQPLGMVVAMAEDIDGNVWAECKSNPRRLVRIRDFQVREEFPVPQVPPGNVLTPDPHGGIWIGTRNGEIVLFRKGVVETKFPLDPGGHPFTHQIIAQADGSVFAASNHGLVEWRQGKVERMTAKNGLPCDSIISFIQDTEKHWWLYTPCGVVELSDSELQRWWADPDAVVQNHVYDTLDGAQPNVAAFNSAARSSDGRVWFVSGIVVQVVDPSRISQKALPAMTYVDSVIADRKEFAATDSIKLPPHLRDLQIDYTSPTFLISQKVKFRYRLDPYDRDWHDAGTRRQAFYTDLPPGRYTFRVIAANSDGAWNKTATKWDFAVAPAYYQTAWFRALCVAAFLGLLWAAYRWRVRQLRKQFEMTLDVRVGERTRIARDLHDTLLQSFQGLLPRFQAAIYKLPEHPADARATLESAVDQASQAITEGRDAVQGLRSSTVEKNDLAVSIQGVAEELALANTHQSSPAFQVSMQGMPRSLHPILRDEVYRIASEALRNAFRHAQARRIEVEIHYDDREFGLHVRDDGKGIDPSVLSGDGREGHFGLHGMRERAKLVGGKLTVWSEVNAGTEVDLRIPASRAYTRPSLPFRFFQKRSKTEKDLKAKIES